MLGHEYEVKEMKKPHPTKWLKKILMPLWCLQCFFMIVVIVVLSYLAAKSMDATASQVVNLLVCNICLFLTVTEIVLYVRRRLLPLSYLILQVVKSTFWFIEFLVVVISNAMTASSPNAQAMSIGPGGQVKYSDSSVASPSSVTALLNGVVESSILLVTFLASLIYASIVFHQYRKLLKSLQAFQQPYKQPAWPHIIGDTSLSSLPPSPRRSLAPTMLDYSMSNASRTNPFSERGIGLGLGLSLTNNAWQQQQQIQQSSPVYPPAIIPQGQPQQDLDLQQQLYHHPNNQVRPSALNSNNQPQSYNSGIIASPTSTAVRMHFTHTSIDTGASVGYPPSYKTLEADLHHGGSRSGTQTDNGGESALCPSTGARASTSKSHQPILEDIYELSANRSSAKGHGRRSRRSHSYSYSHSHSSSRARTSSNPSPPPRLSSVTGAAATTKPNSNAQDEEPPVQGMRWIRPENRGRTPTSSSLGSQGSGSMSIGRTEHGHMGLGMSGEGKRWWRSVRA